MAAEYEIKEVGFVGSLWQGNFEFPIQVGRTIEITNVPNTIEAGGYSKKAIYFASKENLDIDRITNQYPDPNKYYAIGKLSPSDISELEQDTKISSDFLNTLDALFLFDSRAPKNSQNSSVPIQETWGSFDTSNQNDVKYILPSPQSLLYVKYVFPVTTTQLESLKTYFEGIQQTESIFDTPVKANPSNLLIEQRPPVISSFPKNIDFTTLNEDKLLSEVEVIKVLSEQVIHRMEQDVADFELTSDIESAKRFIQIVGGTNNRFFISGQQEFDEKIAELDVALENMKKLNNEPMVTTVMPPVQETVMIVSDESANAMI